MKIGLSNQVLCNRKNTTSDFISKCLDWFDDMQLIRDAGIQNQHLSDSNGRFNQILKKRCHKFFVLGAEAEHRNTFFRIQRLCAHYTCI